MFKDRRFVKRSIIWGKSNSQYVEKNNCVCLLYIRNYKYSHVSPIFGLHNIHLLFSLSTQIQMDIVYGKTGFSYFSSSDVQE